MIPQTHHRAPPWQQILRDIHRDDTEQASRDLDAADAELSDLVDEPLHGTRLAEAHWRQVAASRRLRMLMRGDWRETRVVWIGRDGVAHGQLEIGEA
jgi:hypothetical protein